MLTKPVSGRSDFQLDNTSVYGLSYLDDIAFEWVNQAIHGLETMLPFCVKGALEPDRFLCMVSYWNCHIICEDEERFPLDKADVVNEYSHTSMLEFCKYLYHDINQYMDEWVCFCSYVDIDPEKKKCELEEKLARLKALILKREKWFDKNSAFI